MFIRADNGRYYNLHAMAEIGFCQDRDGTWQLVGRDIGCPIPIVLVDNIPNIGYAKAFFEQYVYGGNRLMLAEWFRPKEEPTGEEA